MSIDTYTFLLVVLGGFFFLWSYGKASGIKKEFKDFEYLVFSTFWGLMLLLALSFSSWVQRIPIPTELLKNPFATGIAMSFAGLAFGWTAGICVGRQIHKKSTQ